MIDPDRAPTIAVIIVNYRTPLLTLAAVAALVTERDQLPGLNVVIVDGGSGDGSAELLRAGIAERGLAEWVQLLPLAINGGFGWANNQAMLALLQSDAPPDYIHLLNPDTRIEPGAVARLADVLEPAPPQCAAVGSLLINERRQPRRVRHSAFRRWHANSREAHAHRHVVGRLLGITRGRSSRTHQPGPADWVTGASMMLRAAALREVGLVR